MTLNEHIRAVHVLQRFVRLSRALLPLYSDLQSKKTLDRTEETRLKKIKGVYENFHANPEASRYLINSDILLLIQNVYSIISRGQSLTPQNLYEYDKFIKESDRLIATWNQQQMN